MEDSKMTCIDILLAIILPPLVAYRKFGFKVEFFICILLTLLGGYLVFSMLFGPSTPHQMVFLSYGGCIKAPFRHNTPSSFMLIPIGSLRSSPDTERIKCLCSSRNCL